jgi:hypothetical protein
MLPKVDRIIKLTLAPLSGINALSHLMGYGPIIQMRCVFRTILNHSCPGCGMTRALELLWRCRFKSAVAMNPLSPIVFLTLWVIFFMEFSSATGIVGKSNKLPEPLLASQLID